MQPVDISAAKIFSRYKQIRELNETLPELINKIELMIKRFRNNSQCLFSIGMAKKAKIIEVALTNAIKFQKQHPAGQEIDALTFLSYNKDGEMSINQALAQHRLPFSAGDTKSTIMVKQLRS